MTSQTMCRYALVRNTMPVDVPAGWPSAKDAVLVEVVKVHDGKCPSVIDALWFPGCGYQVCFSVVDPYATARKLSETAKQSIRRKAIRRRLAAKNPMFIEAEIDAAFAAQPEYYGNIRP